MGGCPEGFARIPVRLLPGPPHVLRLAAPNFRSMVAKDIAVMSPRPLDGLNIRRTDKQEVV